MLDTMIYLAMNDPTLLYVVTALLYLSVFWKGMAFWHAAKNGQKGWFVATLLLNTLGLLPMIYLFVFSKTPILKEFEKMRKKKQRKRKR